MLLAPTLLGADGCDLGESHEICAEVYAPVCGVDGTTYDNACEARRAEVEVAHEGVCEVACYEIYAPVCGDDGVTYPNDCYARAAGASIVREGACECPAVLCDLYCEHGFARDASGCETCTCNPPPLCEPVACRLYCEHGYAIDPSTGCETCACNPPPTAECTGDADCGDAAYCDVSECLPVGDLTVCGGICRPTEPPPTHCDDDADCGEGGRCEPLACTTECAEDDADCAWRCPGICVAELPPPAETCTSDAECAPWQACVFPAIACDCADDVPCVCPDPIGMCADRADDEPAPAPGI